ncbi:hypothetical protein F2P56_001266 [Juglans regia]|uniref:Amidase domain-containing protein n=1 Tax=Juglans regia TaxID=51240 RepID=A0A833Y871_JUGRE|nr:hypothetical protein F2P56_001266 [Juglans regia]
MGLLKEETVVYKPVEEVDVGPHSDQIYVRANVKAPRMAGLLVKIFAWFLESRIFGTLLMYILKKNNLIHKFITNAEIEEPPLFVPSHPFEDDHLKDQQEVKYIDSDLSPPEQVQQAMDCLPHYSSENTVKSDSFHRWTILDYSRAYRSGEITPRMVAERFIKAPVHFRIIDDFMMIYDCCRATRNPYDISKISGGSSSGSAAVVASGLCPAALGVDGGGSVRMPAALCGVVGLKPTFGRIPHSGVFPLNWTVGMVGILAGTIEDAFIVYAAMSGRLPSDQPTSSVQPKVYFPLLNSTEPISDVKLAKYEEWFNDCSDDIRICCSQSLDKLKKHYGWKVVDVTIPEIESMRLAHYSTIASECSTSLSSHLEKLDPAESGWDIRVGLGVYGAFSSKEYIKAQQIRNRQMQFHMKIFAQADVIVSPTTGVTAYPIKDDAVETGELDYINGAALVRYSIAGNFLGLPAVTIPVGYDKLGLPIGLQFIGRPWSEPTLIHIASAMQALCMSEYRKPEVFHDLLNRD